MIPGRSFPLALMLSSSFILPRSSFALLSAFILHPRSPRPVARELPGDAAAARAARERPLQGRALHLFARHPVPARARRLEVLQPDRDYPQVVVLVEGIEGNPEPEALRERDLF